MYIHLGIRERETLVVYTFGKNAQGGRPLEIKQYGNTIVVLPVGIDNFRVEDPWGHLGKEHVMSPSLSNASSGWKTLGDIKLRVEDPWKL